jgi:hypothetical protein
MVSTAMKEHANVDEVNKYLEQTYVISMIKFQISIQRNLNSLMRRSGYNIGLRLVDEFLARSGVV